MSMSYRGIMPRQKSRTSTLQVSDNALQQVETFQHLGVVSSGGRRNKENDARIGDKIQSCVSFGHETGAFNPGP